jgi:hypothetical protein
VNSELWLIAVSLIFSLTILTLAILFLKHLRKTTDALLAENREQMLLLASRNAQDFEALKAATEPPFPGYPAETETYYTADEKQVELLKRVKGLTDDDIAAITGNDGLG